MNKFEWPIRVYYEDTDAGGLVYHSGYLNFFERARTEWLRSLGFEQDQLRDQEGVLFAVKSIQVDYKKPALFNDALTVSVDLQETKRASLVFEQTIYRPQRPAEILCLSLVRVACIDASTLRPRAIPDPVLTRMTA